MTILYSNTISFHKTLAINYLQKDSFFQFYGREREEIALGKKMSTFNRTKTGNGETITQVKEDNIVHMLPQ